MQRIALGLLVAAGCGMDDEPIVVSAAEPLPAYLRAGDIVELGAIAVEVPDLGERVLIVVDTDDGTSHELGLETALDGTVSLVAPGADPITIAADVTQPCLDDAFKLSGHRWRSEYRWQFQAGSTPAGNSKDNVETGLRRAASAITSSRNDCGLADQVGAQHAYTGRTTRAPNIRTTTSGIACGTRDGANVVGFGRLPAGYLGVACSWSDGTGKALEGDVRLTTRHGWFALSVPGGCTSKFGVQAVGAHEFGHVFGLGHVSEADHPNLTMSTATAPCTNAPLTLGLGDVRALRSLY